MALVAGRWFWVFTLVDGGGNTTTRRMELQSADATDAATDVAAGLAALNAITDAVVVSHFWYNEFYEDALVLPAATVQIENMAQMNFTLTNPLKTAVWTLPAPNIGIFAGATGPSSNILDTADVSLLAWTNLFTAAVDPAFFISDGEQAVTFDGGKRIHRGSRRG